MRPTSLFQVAREVMWEEFHYTLNLSEKTLPGVEKVTHARMGGSTATRGMMTPYFFVACLFVCMFAGRW